MWKQLRTSQNHLSSAHTLTTTIPYVQEPGVKIGDKQARYGNIINLTEPVIAQNLTISLVGEVATYNEALGVFERKPVEIKTAFNNETEFFANAKANDYFNTLLDTDDNYEALIGMYLDGGLDDEGSLLDSFSLLTYRQTIWPKVEHSFLDQHVHESSMSTHFGEIFEKIERKTMLKWSMDLPHLLNQCGPWTLLMILQQELGVPVMGPSPSSTTLVEMD